MAEALFAASDGQFASPREAFLAIYGGSVTFEKRNSAGSLGWADKENHIYVNIRAGEITDPKNGEMWAAHELGNAFNYELNPNTTDNLNYGQGIIDLALEGVTTGDGIRFTGIPLNSSSYSNYDIYTRAIDKGYQDTSGPYMQNDSTWPNEDFADMFSNWAYDSFMIDKYGIARYNFMDSHMQGWIELAVTNNQ